MLTRIPLPSLDFFGPPPTALVAPQESGGYVATVEASDLLTLCAGHFPDQPVVPGAHLFAIAHDLASWIVRDEVAQLQPAKCHFRTLVLPHAPIALHAKVQPNGSVRVDITPVDAKDILTQAWFTREEASFT